MDMEQRELGDSGLTVTRMGLGLAALGRPGYINLGHATDLGHDRSVESLCRRSHQVLEEAWRQGIRYFDAARSYGRSESFLGSWISTRQDDAIVVGSKWGYRYTADWSVSADAHEIKEHSVAMLTRQVKESRAELGKRIDLYQIHSATKESGVLENDDVLNQLRALKESGWVIGLTVSGAQQADLIRQAAELVVAGERLFDAVQATWNLLEPSAGRALAEARAAGMGVIVKEGLANGRLTERNSDREFQVKRQMLQRLALEHRVGIDGIALASVLALPWVDCVLSGASSCEQIVANVAGLRVTLSESAKAELIGLSESPEVYWGKRSGLNWN